MDAIETIQIRLNQARERIAQAEARFGRVPSSVRLMAVSKTFLADDVYGALINGQQHFGENYLQEALTKMADARLSGQHITWHFISPLQSNKTKKIAAHFDWVHTVDNLIVAQRLNDQRPDQLPPLNICLQINISNEIGKTGANLEELPELASAVAQLQRLRLRGLMAIPKPSTDFEQQRQPFRALRKALENLRTTGLELDTLSIGMSGDLEAAIAEGATMVRVGTAIFGPRHP